MAAPKPSGLVYYPDDLPGITRRRSGRGFSYFSPEGSLIRDATERARIAAIAVPPAYRSVWITPVAEGHLQATGRDARGRKQYRYHRDWQAMRSQRKYEGLARFGRALPRLRNFIATGLRAPAGSRQLALAAVLALLDRAAIRVGTVEYARENKSYGASTLLGRHVRFHENGVRLTFPGKGGIPVDCQLRGARLQKALQKVHDLPGAALFSWQAEDTTLHTIRSEEVNATLEDICGHGTTAKTFRTWNGTHAAFSMAYAAGALSRSDLAKAAARRLGNSPAIARSSYIHPEVFHLAELSPEQRAARLADLPVTGMSGLRAHEESLVAFLEAAAGDPRATSRADRPEASK